MATSPELIRELVRDFSPANLPKVTPRRLVLPEIPRKGNAVIGFRRSGKTWFLFQQIQAALARGVPAAHILYLDFEDERFAGMEADDLQHVPEALYREAPEAREQGAWLYFDEIHNVPGWERFVRRMIDGPAHVVVSGSSAKLLSREIATSLRGRSLATELLPFGFAEALDHAGVKIPETWPPPVAVRTALEAAFDRYLDVGGFPEVQGLEAADRRRVLQEYVDVALFRDVVERHAVTNVPALRQLVRRLVGNPGGKFAIHRFHNDLQAQGLRVAKDTLHAYLEHLEDAFLVGTVEIASDSVQARRVNPRKAYPIDPALASVITHRPGVGARLECAVYLELRRRGYELAWVGTQDGREVDFLATAPDRPPQLIQVCADLSDPDTRARELGGLDAALGEGPDRSAVVVTRFEQAEIEVRGRSVRLIPAWRWMLEPDPPG